MKRFLSLPRISILRLALVITLSTIMFVDSGCQQNKPGCGNKRDHRKRKKSVKKFAPSMSYIISSKSTCRLYS